MIKKKEDNGNLQSNQGCAELPDGQKGSTKGKCGCVKVNHSSWQHQEMDASPQHTTLLLPWRWAPRATMEKQQLSCVCVYVCLRESL